ncbi:hypothetical protein KAU51_01690 [Candidatus Parcubacteria bacterium]|nr:hypothetical protein [Candidatus Parcubacteria bacterium]
MYKTLSNFWDMLKREIKQDINIIKKEEENEHNILDIMEYRLGILERWSGNIYTSAGNR